MTTDKDKPIYSRDDLATIMGSIGLIGLIGGAPPGLIPAIKMHLLVDHYDHTRKIIEILGSYCLEIAISAKATQECDKERHAHAVKKAHDLINDLVWYLEDHHLEDFEELFSKKSDGMHTKLTLALGTTDDHVAAFTQRDKNRFG